MDGFSQQAFDIAPGILNAMKNAFNAFADVAQQDVKLGWILVGLIGAFDRLHPIAGVFTQRRLPIFPDEPLVAQEVTAVHQLQDNVRRVAFIQVSGHQVIEQRQAVKGREHYGIDPLLWRVGGERLLR